MSTQPASGPSRDRPAADGVPGPTLVHHFLRQVGVAARRWGLEVLEVYGQTEDTGFTTMNRPGRSKIGTVGEIVRGNEVRFTEEGEILVRGGVVFAGYFKDPAATAEVLRPGCGLVRISTVGQPRSSTTARSATRPPRTWRR